MTSTPAPRPETGTETKTVTVERDFAHPPEKVWRALTRADLLSEWLMQTDFSPELGATSTFSADWGAVACQVLEIEPPRRLVTTWVGLGIDTTITWTLTETANGTRLRMEQSGFRRDQGRAYGGARANWPNLLDRLETCLAHLA